MPLTRNVRERPSIPGLMPKPKTVSYAEVTRLLNEITGRMNNGLFVAGDYPVLPKDAANIRKSEKPTMPSESRSNLES